MNEIFFCPVCWEQRKKVRNFKSVKNLNIHLKMKHGSQFSYKVVNGVTRRVIGVKLPKFVSQSS